MEKVSELKVGDDYKETMLSGHSRAAAHVKSQRFTAHTHFANDQVRQNLIKK